MLHKSEEKKVWALQKYLSEWCIKGDHLLKKSDWWDQYFTFMDDLVVEFWSHVAVKSFKKSLSFAEGCIKSDHLLKKSGWSDQYLHFYEWISGWCYWEIVNVGL